MMWYFRLTAFVWAMVLGGCLMMRKKRLSEEAELFVMVLYIAACVGQFMGFLLGWGFE